MLLSFSFSFPVSSIGTKIPPVTVFFHLFTKTLPLNLKESSNISQLFSLGADISYMFGHVLRLASEFNVQHSTWSKCQAPQTPYAIQRSSLLVQVLTNLPCCYPEEDNARFINVFLECLQTKSSLPGGAAKRTYAARKNLCIYFDFNTSFS
ncbi:hypothetical protein Hanom_Chr08g00691261 [Helianthus anomalus]